MVGHGASRRRSGMRRSTIAMLVLAPLAVTFTSSASEPVRTSPEQVRQWIDQLDDDDYAVREKAESALSQAGAPAILLLAEGVVSSNPEVAWRSSETLERIAMEGDEATMDRVVGVLSDLAK